MTEGKQYLLDSMMNSIIKRYGFEAKKTIKFCQLCEDVEHGKKTFKKAIKKYEKLY